MFLGLLVAIGAVFTAGAYTGRWAVKNQTSARFREAFSSLLGAKPPSDDLAATGDWQPKNTDLVQIETSIVHLPNSDGWGGGIQPLDDGRIFYGTRTGEFGVIGNDGITTVLPFKIEMNLDALKHHPVFKLKNFNYNWVRVTDINLSRIGEGRYQLLVGHHYFEPKEQCMELRLSRAVINVKGSDIKLSEPFRTILTTKPCITFNSPEYEFAFEGHFSGGRIARLAGNQVLFTTGDHGWVGLRGYPAVSQDDNSTLGKVLLIDVATNDVSIYAKGLRNPQGLTIDSKGRIWETEQGPRGGDELNLIVKGENYGWPDSTYGTDYGPRPWPINVEQGRHFAGISPQFAWNPSIGVSNVIEVTSKEFPLWKGDLLVLSLVGQTIHRLRLEDTRIVYDEPINFQGDRLRDIVELKNGLIAVLTDHGTVLLLRNADRNDKAPYLDVNRQQPRTSDLSAQQRAVAIAGRYAGNEEVAAVSEQLSAAATRGEQVFKANCASCHSLDTASIVVGPSLMGVIGRKVGSSTEFAYSAALSGKREAWSSRHIVDFAVNPAGIYAGTSMTPIPLTTGLQRDLESYLDATAVSRSRK